MSYKLDTYHKVYRTLPHSSLIDGIYRVKNEVFLNLVNAFFVFYLRSRLFNLFAFGNSHFNFNSMSTF